MPRHTPLEAIRSRLQPVLGDDTERLPRHWRLWGDVLVLRDVQQAFPDHAREVAEAYAAQLGARVVLEDADGVHGPHREPNMRRLWGEGTTETTFLQDGIRYSMDAGQLMFSAGNLAERQRMARLDARGETVVDLFAGIGYFTLPLLVHAGAARVAACEINPVAAGYLRGNAAANRVADRIEVLEGDCREVAPRGIAHRVVSGWFPGGHAFLDAALDALRPEGGVVHYHDTAHAARAEEELVAHLRTAARRAGRRIDAVQTRVVKSYAPGVVHVVADATVTAYPQEKAEDDGPGGQSGQVAHEPGVDPQA